MSPRAASASLAILLVVAMPQLARGQEVLRVTVANDGTAANSDSFDGDVCGDGSRVVFQSYATNLVAGFTGAPAIYLRDVASSTTSLMSVSSNGTPGNDSAYRPRVSADGAFVAFESIASNLVPRDFNGTTDVFVHDVAAATTFRVSVSTGGGEANGPSFHAAVSSDCRYVTFSSFASNLVSGDTNGVTDVFVRDRVAKTTTRVSLAFDGSEANSNCVNPDVSADGRFVSFESSSNNLVPNDGNGSSDVFVVEVATGSIVRASVDSAGNEANGTSQHAFLSGDGNLVTFDTFATNLSSDASKGFQVVYVHDRTTLATTRVSVDSSGSAPIEPYGWDQSSAPFLSDDGRFISFTSICQDLAAGDHDTSLDSFVRTLPLGMTTRQSLKWDGSESAGTAFAGAISADGRQVLFSSDDPTIVQDDQAAHLQIYRRERPVDDAAAVNYGSGVAGRFGVPTLDATAPRLNGGCTVSIGNSLGAWTVGLLVLGTQQAQIPTSWGGDLLVLPTIVTLIALPPAGLSLPGTIPPDESLAAIALFAQVLELDRFAVDGVSFTPGLELDFGF